MEGTTGYESKVEFFFLEDPITVLPCTYLQANWNFCESSVLCKGKFTQWARTGFGYWLSFGVYHLVPWRTILVSLNLNFCIYKMKMLNLMLFLVGILIMPCNYVDFYYLKSDFGYGLT